MVQNSDAPNKNNLSDRIKLFIDDLANATEEAAADAKIKQYLNFFSKSTDVIFSSEDSFASAFFFAHEFRKNPSIKSGNKYFIVIVINLLQMLILHLSPKFPFHMAYN